MYSKKLINYSAMKNDSTFNSKSSKITKICFLKVLNLSGLMFIISDSFSINFLIHNVKTFKNLVMENSKTLSFDGSIHNSILNYTLNSLRTTNSWKHLITNLCMKSTKSIFTFEYG